MKKEVLCIVSGKVQDVFFRAFAEKKAAEFSVTGYAKNLPDSTVEVVAQGDEEKVKLFVQAISAGPEEAEVESMNVSWGKPSADYPDFHIF